MNMVIYIQHFVSLVIDDLNNVLGDAIQHGLWNYKKSHRIYNVNAWVGINFIMDDMHYFHCLLPRKLTKHIINSLRPSDAYMRQ